MGNQNKIIQIAIAAITLLGALVLVTNWVTLPEFYQIAILIIIVMISTILLVRRDLAFDMKILCMLMVGYSFAGKGFAYLTPFEPVYIGEITMIICALGLIYRWLSGGEVMPTHLHWILLGWMLVVGLYLLYNFPEAKLMAIRDSAMAYYAFFFFASFAIFRNPTASKAFSGILKCCVILGCLSSIILSTVWQPMVEAFPAAQRFFIPHPDTFLPLIAAGAMYGLLEGMSRRSILLLTGGGIGLLLLLLTKTAGIFCFLSVLGVLVIFAKRIDILFTAVFGVALAAITIAILLAAGVDFVEEKILESDQVQTLTDLTNVSGKSNDNTTDWRISWWSIIIEDTLDQNPAFGAGMGGDITSHFVQSILRIDLSSIEGQTFARYPHNILMTVLGRMGFVGLAIFIIPFTAMTLFGIRFIAQNLRTPEENRHYQIAAVIYFSGIANSLVQSTYEVPYGAIIHWTCLGYLAAYRYPRKGRNSINLRKPGRLRPELSAIGHAD